MNAYEIELSVIRETRAAAWRDEAKWREMRVEVEAAKRRLAEAGLGEVLGEGVAPRTGAGVVFDDPKLTWAAGCLAAPCARCAPHGRGCFGYHTRKWDYEPTPDCPLEYWDTHCGEYPPD